MKTLGKVEQNGRIEPKLAAEFFNLVKEWVFEFKRQMNCIQKIHNVSMNELLSKRQIFGKTECLQNLAIASRYLKVNLQLNRLHPILRYP